MPEGELPTKMYVATCVIDDIRNSLPLMIFADRDVALRWARAQPDAHRITEVAVYPEPPIAPWFRLEPITEPSDA